eukprot:49450-Eustigmatos_ZCMA.PRE.1
MWERRHPGSDIAHVVTGYTRHEWLKISGDDPDRAGGYASAHSSGYGSDSSVASGSRSRLNGKRSRGRPGGDSDSESEEETYSVRRGRR